MLYSIKNNEELENLHKSISLQNQIIEVRSQDKLGEQNYHQNTKIIFEPMTDAIKKTSEKLTKTITETSINNKKAIENLNENNLELMNDKGMIAPYLVSSLVNLFKPETKSQFRLLKDLSSISVKDFLINGGIQITLYSNMLTFRDSIKSFNLDGDLLETLTNYDFNVSHSNAKDQKLIYEYGIKTNFDFRQKGRKNDRDKSLIKLLISPAIMASGISTILLPSDPNEMCERLKLILQEKQAGKNSNIITDEITAIFDNLIEYKCISKKQNKQVLIKCNLLHTNKK